MHRNCSLGRSGPTPPEGQEEEKIILFQEAPGIQPGSFPFGYSTKNMNQKTYITGAAAIVLGVLVPVGDLPGPIALLVGSAAAICGAVTLYDVIKQTGRKP